MTLEEFIHELMPPIITKIRRKMIGKKFHPDHHFEFKTDTTQSLGSCEGNNTGWEADSVVNDEKSRWNQFLELLSDNGPLGFNHEYHDLNVVRSLMFHNNHVSFGYVLGLSMFGKQSVVILDWGGGLGHYYHLAKALYPDTEFEYHCKELKNMVIAGKALPANKNIIWHTGDSYLSETYDLVMLNGSLQYSENWKEILENIGHITKEYLFLTRIAVLENSPQFAATQRSYNTRMIHWQLNKHELLSSVAEQGFEQIREFVIGPGIPKIHGAPEQPIMCGWLFKKKQKSDINLE